MYNVYNGERAASTMVVESSMVEHRFSPATKRCTNGAVNTSSTPTTFRICSYFQAIGDTYFLSIFILCLLVVLIELNGFR